MVPLGKPVLSALALFLCVAAAAGAQQPQATGAQQPQAKACTIDETNPKELATASLALAMAGSPAGGKQLQSSVKKLTENPGKLGNPAGRNLVLGKLYMAWLQQPGIGQVAKRGDVGLTTEKEATIDLVAAADTAFSAAERAAPECAAEVAVARRQPYWQKTINASLTALNGNQLDSAEALAKRSMLIDRGTPYPYYVLASVAQRRKEVPIAVSMHGKAVELAGTDTTYGEIRRYALVNLGALLSQQAQATTDKKQRDSLARAAASVLRTFIDEAPTDPDAGVARTTLVQMMKLAGDSAAIASTYADPLANPSKYSDQQLAEAGVTAARANRAADAARLFEAAIAANPYHRDALYSLGASYYAAGDYEKMIPIAQRLVALDPANPDNWQLFSFAYGGLLKKSKDAKAKRTYTDSLQKYYEKSSKMPVKVAFTHFSRGSDKTVLGGEVENKGNAAKTYDLKFEFLDKSGAVITSQQTSVGPVAPKQSKPFSITVNQPGVAGYRYAPLP